MPRQAERVEVVVSGSVFQKVLLGLLIAAAISWIVYVAKAANNDVLGDNDIFSADTTREEKQGKGAANVETATVCFQAIVATALIYFVLNHHLSTY